MRIYKVWFVIVITSVAWYKLFNLIHIDQLKYKEFSFNSERMLQNHQVVNFDIFHQQCRGYPFQKPLKVYKTVVSDDYRNYPQPGMKGIIECVQRTDRKDLFLVKKKTLLEH